MLGKQILSNFFRINFTRFFTGTFPIGSIELVQIYIYIYIQVVPGRAGGGSFRRKKNYIAKKEFAYRMCARRPTSAMPKPFLCCERAFCCSMVVMWPDLMHVMSFDVVVMSFDATWLLVLCHVTWCNAMSCDVRSCDVPCNGHVVCSKWFCDNVVIESTILYYKVLLQYYSVLHSTTPVLLCTTKYYSSTTLYCKVLQYYSVLQSTTPVLLCTTKYYSSTTLYCKVLLQYYSVLQSTTPVLLCTTKYYSSTTLYYKVLLQYYSVLHSTTTSTTLYYKAAFMIDVPRIWNVIYNARSNRSHPPTSRNTAPATQNDCDDWSASHMKRHLQWAEQQESQSIFTKYCTCHAKWMPSVIRVTYETSFPMRGASKVTLQTHQLLRLPRKMNLMIDPRHIWNVIHNARSNRVDASNFTKYCACHAKCISWLIRISYETSFRMRGASKVNLEPHQILPVPRKMNLMIDPRHIWNVI